MKKTRIFTAVLTAVILLVSMICFSVPFTAAELPEEDGYVDEYVIDDGFYGENYDHDLENEAIIGGADEPTAILIASRSDVSFTDADAADVSASDIKENDRAKNISDALKIMGQGMLGIFVVMLLIYLVIVILNKATAGLSKEEDE